MSDVHLFQTPDGGEISFVAGQAQMNDGLETATFLSLWGGNEDDSGLEADDAKQWWANHSEPDLSRRYRSELQFVLNTLPLLPVNLIRFHDAATRDLAWLADSLADSVDVTVTIPALNTIDIGIKIVIDDVLYSFAFTNAARARLTQ
jgi:phage gp46-like protein